MHLNWCTCNGDSTSHRISESDKICLSFSESKDFFQIFLPLFILNKHICASLNNSFTEFILVPPWMSYKPIFTFVIVIYFRESNGYNDGKHWLAFFSRIIAIILFFIELAIDGEVVFRKSNRKRGQRPD